MSNRRIGFPEISEIQKSIITGSLLGDGCINNPEYGNSQFIKNQCLKHRDYLVWHVEQFNPLDVALKDSDNYAEGKCYKRCNFTTQTHPYLTMLREQWYPEGKKIVPRSLSLDPLALAVWYFDDGSNYIKRNKHQIKLHTCAFSKEDCEFLITLLHREFGIASRLQKRNRIYIERLSYDIFIDIVSPYMLWDCFRHKITKSQPKIRKYITWNGVKLKA